jgi:hypothetical protein
MSIDNMSSELKQLNETVLQCYTLRNGSGSKPNQSGWFECGFGSGSVFQDLETTLEPVRTRKNLYIESFYI